MTFDYPIARGDLKQKIGNPPALLRPPFPLHPMRA
jgi:hypothetical protein